MLPKPISMALCRSFDMTQATPKSDWILNPSPSPEAAFFPPERTNGSSLSHADDLGETPASITPAFLAAEGAKSTRRVPPPINTSIVVQVKASTFICRPNRQT